MLASKSLLTRPIVSLDEGQKIGTVRGLVVDPKALEVVALQVDHKGLFREQKIIPYAKVHSIGEAAIVIDQSSQVQRATNLPQLIQLLKEKVTIIGAKVLTTRGRKLGVIEEYYVDRRTGKLTSVEIRGNFGQGWFSSKAELPASAIRTISAEMVIVYEDSLEQMSLIESTLDETMKKVNETSGKLWDSTVTVSREWGEALSRSFEKIRFIGKKKPEINDDEDVNPWKTPDHAGSTEVVPPSSEVVFTSDVVQPPSSETIPRPSSVEAKPQSPEPDIPQEPSSKDSNELNIVSEGKVAITLEPAEIPPVEAQELTKEILPEEKPPGPNGQAAPKIV